jgi:hypothetical protein
MPQNETSREASDGASQEFSLTRRERRILRGFCRRYRMRWVTRVFVWLLLFYCIGVGAMSIYYAAEMLRGRESLPQTSEGLQQSFERIAPVLREIPFVGVVWVNLLHAALLLYIGSRAFRLLYRLHHTTPRAQLAVKLARRLEELGEIDLEEKECPKRQEG